MHQRIGSLGGLLNQGDINRTTGITGLVYKTIRLATSLSFKGIDFALATFKPLMPIPNLDQRRLQWISVLNGIMGDHLVETQNPLALDMTWHHKGQTISPKQAAELCHQSSGQPLLLIHGLCMNDQMWLRNGHDHGMALEKNQSMIPIYIRYNSGLAVYQNGLTLERMLSVFFNTFHSKKSCDVLCHSMGGLVFRSALHIANESNQTWLKHINKVVFLGTPHQGAVLEKTGNFIDYLFSINPYFVPFSKIIKLRSHGIKNLRHGTVTQDHQTIQLPDCIDAHAIAGSTHCDGHAMHHKWIGDGLVSVDSALGGHKHPEREVVFNDKNKHTFKKVSHMGLLSSKRVFNCLQLIYKYEN